jgi:hypothetical protein
MDLVGIVDSDPVSLVVTIDTKAAPVPGRASMSEVGQGSIWVFGPVQRQWYSTKGMDEASYVSVNSDLHSGHMSVGIPEGPYQPLLRIDGDWRCS